MGDPGRINAPRRWASSEAQFGRTTDDVGGGVGIVAVGEEPAEDVARVHASSNDPAETPAKAHAAARVRKVRRRTRGC